MLCSEMLVWQRTQSLEIRINVEQHVATCSQILPLHISIIFISPQEKKMTDLGTAEFSSFKFVTTSLISRVMFVVE